MKFPGSREVLYHRHQLSHQQIDDLLGDQGSRDFREAKAQMLAKLNVFLGVSRLLTEAGIAFIPLKGFLLSQRIYGDPSYRITGDSDLLIKPERVSDAIRVLLKNGYHPDYFSWPEKPFREKLVLNHLNQFPISNSSSGAIVELHWRLFGNRLVSNKKLDAIIGENPQTIQLAGQSCRQFNHELELIYLIIHGGLHAWRRLKWLVDVKELRDRFPLDEDKFQQLCKKLKAQRMVAVCNAMLGEFFPETKPFPCREKPKPFLLRYSRENIYKETETLGKGFRETFNRARFKLIAFPGLRYKLSAFRFSTFTQKEVNEDWFPPYPLLVILQRLWNKVFKGK